MVRTCILCHRYLLVMAVWLQLLEWNLKYITDSFYSLQKVNSL